MALKVMRRIHYSYLGIELAVADLGDNSIAVAPHIPDLGGRVLAARTPDARNKALRRVLADILAKMAIPTAHVPGLPPSHTYIAPRDQI